MFASGGRSEALLGLVRLKNPDPYNEIMLWRRDIRKREEWCHAGHHLG
jgi:hypothetical protein